MCGIAGTLILDGKATADRDMIRRMTNAMAHRGPDAEGLLVEGPLAFGHRRLSIIDLSTAANQPIEDASGRYVMVFNGEMYNYMDVRRELSDYPYKTNGDSEVILAAFAAWGPSCVEKFKGMFVFAIWDRHDRTLTLCRDRLGVKPLYLHTSKGILYFSSEIRSLLASGSIERKLDRRALTDFFAYQSFGGQGSAIEGIEQLKAGSWMRISARGREEHVYWEPASKAVTPFHDDPAQVKTRVRSLLRDAVERRLVSDVPVGAFLSGGIDSSAVVGLMAETGKGRPQTFHVTFAEKDFDESEYAQLVAKKFDTVHHEIRLRPEVMLEELEHALGALDTPSGDGINTYVVSKAIREAGVTVALSGVGGDELFAGYPFFRQYMGIMRYEGAMKMSGALRRAAGSLLASGAKGRLARMAGLLKAREVGIAGFYPVFRQILDPGQRGKLLSIPDPINTSLEKELLGLGSELTSLPLLSQVSVAEYHGYTQHTLLKDTDQMSMAVSLEVREPFFDHDLVEYMLGVPDVIKYPTTPKQLLVDSLGDLLPSDIVHRPKKGFTFPWAIWMKRELRSFCESRIQAIGQRDFVDGAELSNLWKRFLKGDPSVRWMELWLFVVLASWMERNGIE